MLFGLVRLWKCGDRIELISVGRTTNRFICRIYIVNFTKQHSTFWIEILLAKMLRWSLASSAFNLNIWQHSLVLKICHWWCHHFRCICEFNQKQTDLNWEIQRLGILFFRLSCSKRILFFILFLNTWHMKRDILLQLWMMI